MVGEVCPHKDAGCTWRGEIQQLSRYLKYTISSAVPVPGISMYLYTVRFLAPICISLFSIMFSEPILRQSHTARQRQIKGKEYSLSFLGRS